MSRRHLAALTAGTALALTPALASAQTAATPQIAVRAGHAGAAPTATYHAVAPQTTAGITPAISCTGSDARTFACDATASTDTASTITSYTFDFGDGSTATTNTTGTASYAYTTPGTYTITLTVKDAAGNSASVTTTVTTLGSDYTAYGPTRILDTRNGTGQGGTIQKIPADTAIKLKIGGNGSIPTDATAVAINLTATNTTAAGYLSAYPDGTTRSSSSILNFASGTTLAGLTTVAVGSDGYIDLYNDSTGTIDLVGDANGYFTPTASSGYTPLSPDRILDTRTTTGGHDAPIPANGTLTLTVAGADGGLLPSTGITAVAINLTATDETSNGALTAYPDGATRPTASNLDYGKDTNLANYAVVPVGTDGKIDVYNSSTGTANLVGDVTGYFSTSSTSSYVPITPTRSLDTRTLPAGTVCADCIAQDTALNSTTNNATAYAITATVTTTTAVGDLIVYPAGATLPTASNIDWASGETIANSTYAAPSSTGIYLYNQSAGTMNVIVDEYGYYTNQ